MDQAVRDAATADASAENLPVDFLRLLFARLSARDLCTTARVCRSWDQLTRECWRAKVERRWKHGFEHAHWPELQRRGEWKRLYKERHKLDASVRFALRDLAWPLRREGGMRALLEAGEAGLDQLIALLGPGDGEEEEEEAEEERGQGGGGGGCGPTPGREPGLGPLATRYWAEQALTSLRRRQAVAVLAGLAADPRDAPARMEAAALAFAQAHYPTADLSRVGTELEALGQELRRRMRGAVAAPGGLQALHILNHLLFGPPPETFPPASSSATATVAAAASNATAASTPTLASLAGPDGGLGLRGSDPDAYYDPRNSLICDVLGSRRGIPISLAALQACVAARGGLGGRLDLIGLPARVVNRFIPDSPGGDAAAAGDATVAAAGGAADSGGGGGGGSAPAGEVFIDVFGGGTLLEWGKLRSLMAGLGVPLSRVHVRPLDPPALAERMAANLQAIYEATDNAPCQHLALQLAWGASQPRNQLTPRLHLAMQLEEWGDAEACVGELEAGMEGAVGSLAGVVWDSGGGAAGGEAEAEAGGEAVPEGLAAYIRQTLASHTAELRAELEQQRAEWAAEQGAVKRRRPAAAAAAEGKGVEGTAGVEAATAGAEAEAKAAEAEPPELFPIGLMVQHRVYGYRGVIVDRDPKCRMSQEWIAQMGVDALPGGGRRQPFYRVLVGEGPQESEEEAGEAGEEAGEEEAGGQQQQGNPAHAAGGGGGGGGQGPQQRRRRQRRRGGGGGGGLAVWSPSGPCSRLRGLHSDPRGAHETYVAHVNIHVLVPQPPPPPPSVGGAAAAAAGAPAVPLKAAGAGSESRAERSAGWDASGAASGAPAQPPPPPLRLPAGAVTVPVPRDFQVRHPQLGRYLAGKPPGAPRYVPTTATRTRFPDDDWGADPWGAGGGGGGGGAELTRAGAAGGAMEAGMGAGRAGETGVAGGGAAGAGGGWGYWWSAWGDAEG